MVVMRRDAVATVAVEIQSSAVERRLRCIANVTRGLGNGRRHRVLREAITCRQPRYVDFAIVHHSARRIPFYTIAQAIEPAPRRLYVGEAGSVDDGSRFVVHEGATAGAEETELRRRA